MRRLLLGLLDTAKQAATISVLALVLALAALAMAGWAIYEILATRQDVWLSYTANVGTEPTPVFAALALTMLALVAATVLLAYRQVRR